MDIAYIAVNKQNVEYFTPLLPEDIKEKLYMNNAVYGLGIVDDQNACGILVYTMDTESELPMCDLLYIAVSERYQQKGIARAALLELAHICYQEGYYLHCIFSADEKDEAVYQLILSTGVFSIQKTEGNMGHVTKDVILTQPLINQCMGKKNPGVKDYNRLLRIEKNAAKKLLLEAGYSNEYLAKSRFEEYSFFYPNKDNEIEIMVVIGKLDDGDDFEILYIYAASKKNAAMFGIILAEAFVKMSNDMKDDSKAYFCCVNKEVAANAEKFLTGMQVETQFYEALYDGEA